MSSRSLTVPQSSGLLAAIRGDQTNNEALAIQKAAFLKRLERSAERDLGLLEMTDLEALGSRGIVAARNTADQAVAAIQANPCSADGVSRLLNTTNEGLDRAMRRYQEGA
jgi:hypothetical protein